MINKIKTYCLQKELLQQGDRVLLGLSGGADSVCLLFVLLSLAEEWGLSLILVHVNHHLRGEEAERDEQFCKDLCARQGLSLVVVHADIRGLAKEHGWSLEEAGRNARYEAFYRIAGEQGCTKIAVAHHRNDQAETVLFQLFRGSRLLGLSGMEAKSGCIIRPLLSVSREEIEVYVRGLGEAYCTDSTNLTGDYARNRIRQGILPAAEEISNGAARHIAETAEYLQRVGRFVQKEADALYGRAVTRRMPHGDNAGGINAEGTNVKDTNAGGANADGINAEGVWVVSLAQLEKADSLLAEQVVYRVLCEAAGQKKDITAEHVADCLRLSKKQTGRSIRLPYGVTAVKSYGNLVFSKGMKKEEGSFCCRIAAFPADEKLPLPAGGFQEGKLSKELGLSGGGFWLSFDLEETGNQTKKYIEKYGGIPKCTYTKWFDYDKIKDIICLRMAMPQDSLALYADGRGKPLLPLLADAKVPKAERHGIILLAEGSRVLWVPGVRGSEAYHVTEQTRRILIATIHGEKG